jgi:hypothetical protein
LFQSDISGDLICPSVRQVRERSALGDAGLLRDLADTLVDQLTGSTGKEVDAMSLEGIVQFAGQVSPSPWPAEVAARRHASSPLLGIR